MLYLIIDAGQKFKPKHDYDKFESRDISSVKSKNRRLRILLRTVSFITDTRLVVIYDVDDLNARESTTLVEMLYDKHPDVKVIMTCKYEEDVSKHIRNMLGLRKKKVRSPGIKRERSFFDKLKLYIQTNVPVEQGLLLPFIKGIGFNRKLTSYNKELVAELDEMLFETHEEYLSYAWAGLHKPQKIRPKFKEVFKPEKVKKPKKTSVARKTRRVKKKQKTKVNRTKASRLRDFF